MFTTTVMPRFFETDAFGHVNNTVVGGWFETAREPIFRIFSPDMDIRQLSLILARTEVDFTTQKSQPLTETQRLALAAHLVG